MSPRARSFPHEDVRVPTPDPSTVMTSLRKGERHLRPVAVDWVLAGYDFYVGGFVRAVGGVGSF
jgi:hypothetical protein